MQLSMHLVFPGCLDDFGRMAAGYQPSAVLSGVDVSGVKQTLIVIGVAQGTAVGGLSLVGADATGANIYMMPAEGSQFTELVRVKQTTENGTFNTAEEADLTAPNSDVVHFDFDFSALQGGGQ